MATTAAHPDLADLGALLFDTVRPKHNIVYARPDGQPVALDAYLRKDTIGPNRTIVFIHGGGWVSDNHKETVFPALPFLLNGWHLVSVGYRLADRAPAPAAAEDVRCALAWLAGDAGRLGIDLQRIVVMGISAGALLGTLAAFAPIDAGFNPAWTPPPVAAVVNLFGITDLTDVLEGPNRREFAERWFEGVAERDDLARRLSPLTWVRPGLSPMITVHGDADRDAPYEQAVRLHAALDAAGVANRLVTLKGAGHGCWTEPVVRTAYGAIDGFLARHVP